MKGTHLAAILLTVAALTILVLIFPNIERGIRMSSIPSYDPIVCSEAEDMGVYNARGEYLPAVNCN